MIDADSYSEPLPQTILHKLTNQRSFTQAGYTEIRQILVCQILVCCQADLRDSVVLDVELKEYERGLLSVGTSPSYENRKKKERWRKAQMNKL